MRRYICLFVLSLGLCFLWSQTAAVPDIYSDAVIKNLSTPAPDLAALATASYQKGDYEAAAKQYLAHLASKPGDASALYNLACCYGLLGREKHASEILQLAYKAGFDDLEHIQRDTDFDKVRQSPEFVAGMDSLKVWAARKAESAGEKHFYRLNTYLPYHIYYPANYRQDTQYALVVGLHGYGDNAVAFGNISRLLKDMPVIYLVPEAPYTMDLGGRQGFSWTPSMDTEDPLQVGSFIGLNDGIVDLVRQIQVSHKIGKTILFGFSQGCFMTYQVGIGNPDVFDGLIAFAGWMMPELIQDAAIKATRLPKVYISHGKQDRVITHDASDQALAWLLEHKYEARLNSFEGDHRVDRTSFMEGLNWILAE